MDILDLNAPIERPKVSLGDAQYELRMPVDMSMAESAFVASVSKKVGRLTEEFDEAEANRLMADMDKAIKSLVIDLPDEVFATLGQRHKNLILQFWGEQAKKASEVEEQSENPTE